MAVGTFSRICDLMARKGRNEDQLDAIDGGAYRELRLLDEMERAPQVSQRHLARQLGVALGVANLLVRSLVAKGYVRAAQVGWKRWVYILTPAGFTRKVHLTLQYVERFLGHYQRVRTLLDQDLKELTLTAESRIGIYGTTELTELMYLALREIGITEIDFIDGNPGTRFLGTPVKTLESIDPLAYDRLLLAFSSDVERRRRELIASGVSPSLIVTPLRNSKYHPATVDRASGPKEA